MLKCEKSEVLGMIEKADPYTKKSRAKKAPKKKSEIPEIIKFVNKYVKDHKMTSTPVKEDFKPPKDAVNYYYFWSTYNVLNDNQIARGKTIRQYIIPYGTPVNIKTSRGVKKIIFDSDSERTWGAYLGSNPRNRVIDENRLKSQENPIFGKGIDNWIAPSPPWEKLNTNSQKFKAYLKALGESLTEFKKGYVPGVTHATLRKAGNEYSFS